MKKFLLILFAGLFLLSACLPAATPTSSGPSVETIVATTLQAMTAAAPTVAPPTEAPQGLPVSYGYASFVIPLALNASANHSTTQDVEFPYINPGGGPMADHVAFDLTNYPLEGTNRVVVFLASDYATYSSSLQDTVTALLAGEDANPTLPDALTAGDFYAQAKQVNFQNGHGVRYVTEVLTGFAPINNGDVFYFYQGITNDGKYFVSAVLRISASFLVANGTQNATTPADGVPFDWSSNLNYPQYLSDITTRMNSATSTDFSPSLDTLDALIQSITITTP